jgi:thioredoxin-related protein
MDKVILILFCVVLSGSACSNNQPEAFEYSSDKTEADWISYFSEIGYNVTDLSNHTILVMHPSNCASCINELEWWNNKYQEGFKSKISIVLIERHEATQNNFIDLHKLQLPILNDREGEVLKKELVPATPVKIYFNSNSEQVTMMPINNNNLSQFLKKVE